MPNVLDAEPMRAFARRAGQKIPEGPVRARFEHLIYEQLMSNATNFRPARGDEIAAAPAWARAAAGRGENLVAFKVSRSACTTLHNIARWLGAVCKLALQDCLKQSHLADAILAAQRLIAKINHAAFAIIAAKARRLAHAYRRLNTDADLEPRCDARAVPATGRCRWHRVTSVAALRDVGREFRNCLARPPHAEHHAGNLRSGLRQYWVLRGVDGDGLVVAMADAPMATHFIEIRGPNNAQVRNRQVDLMRLAAAIGIPADPPPPPPPPGLEALALSLQRIIPRRCTCSRCVSNRLASHLPRMAAAP